MTMRWQERRVEDDLLKRELLLRLRAEHHAAPGRSRPATDYFRRRVRRLMLRHPLFAFKYHLLAVDLGLGRFDADNPRGRRPSLKSKRRSKGPLIGLLAAAVAAALVGTHSIGPPGRAGAPTSATPRASHLTSNNWWHPPRHVAMPRRATTARESTSQRERHPTAKKPRQGEPSFAPPTILVSSTVARAAVSTPAPLPSPAGGSPPGPLKAP
jgi:hypothetical protein